MFDFIDFINTILICFLIMYFMNLYHRICLENNLKFFEFYKSYNISKFWRFITSYRYKYIITNMQYCAKLHEICYYYQLRYDKWKNEFQLTTNDKYDEIVDVDNNDNLFCLYVDFKYRQHVENKNPEDLYKYEVDIQEYNGKLFLNKYITSQYIDYIQNLVNNKTKKQSKLKISKFGKIQYIGQKIIHNNN